MKIEFGGGEDPVFPDFDQCDVRDLPGIKYVCDAWDIDKHVESDTVEQIFSRHFFEHLTFHQGEQFIKSCHSVMKDGGEYVMIIPNFVWHVRQWLTEENVMGFDVEDPFTRGREGLWGKQRGSDKGELWDTHKAGYKKWELQDLLERNGFVDVEFPEEKIKNIVIRAKAKK